jgi:hypothetical protein
MMVMEVASVVVQVTTAGAIRRVYEPVATRVLRLADSAGATVSTRRCPEPAIGALMLPAVSVTAAAASAWLELSSGRLCSVQADAAEALAGPLLTTPPAPMRPA